MSKGKNGHSNFNYKIKLDIGSYLKLKYKYYDKIRTVQNKK